MATPPEPTPVETATPAPEQVTTPDRPVIYGYEVVATYPHGTDDFTQGLFIADGALYETTGKIGNSSLIRHDILGTHEQARMPLRSTVFGEGSVAVDGKILTLTWRSGVGLIHNLDTLEEEGSFPLEGEGWGLTYDGERLIVSDGTNRLRFLDPETYEETGSLAVYAGTKPLPRINELEFINGEIWANIWQSDVIARINPADGKVTGFVNLSGIHPNRNNPVDDVLNGIAYDPQSERLFVTGKFWDTIYEINITERK